MTGPTPSEPAQPVEEEPSESGVEAGRDLQAGRDIAGRDISTQTIYAGFSQENVIRLVILVSLLVFLTATCFFAGGVAVGAGAVEAFRREVNLDPQAAESLQRKLQEIQALPPNQPFSLQLSEEELNAYFHFIVGPQVGVEDGQARLVSGGALAISGRLRDAYSLPFIATFAVQPEPAETLQLKSAAVRLFGSGANRIGWAPAPRAWVEPLEARINEFLGRGFQVTEIETPPGQPPVWEVDGVTIP